MMFLSKHFAPLLAMIKLALRIAPGLFALILLLNMLASIVPAGLIYIGKAILDHLISAISNPIARQIQILLLWVAAECLLRFVQIILGRLTLLCNQRFSNRLQYQIQQDFLSACAREPYHHFEDAAFYQKLQMMINRVFYGASGYLLQWITWFRSIMQLLSILALLAHINLVFLFVIVTLNVFSFWSNCQRIQRNFAQEDMLNKKQRQISYLFQILTSDIFLRDLKLFGAEVFFQKRYLDRYQDLQMQRHAILKKDQQHSNALEILTTLSYYAFYIYIIFGVLHKKLTVGDISLYQRAYTALDNGIHTFLTGFSSLYENNLYFEQYFDFVAIKKSIGTPKILEGAFNKLRVHNLNFTYPQAKCAALHNINLDLQSGEIIAIVGPNGCGKTTLIKLLSGLYPLTSGTIQVQDADLSAIDLASYQKRLGVIFQDFNRYALSFKDNLICAQTEYAEDTQRLLQAIQAAQLNGVLEKMSLGLETILAQSYEHGQQPSSGEWQKIALARLLFRDPDLIVLDEALANLDNENRNHFVQLLRVFAKEQKKMIVLIGHQLPCLQFVDKIYVMDQGHIVESGSHETLLTQQGRYYDLWLKDQLLES